MGESNAVEQAVSRALRDNLGRIQRTTDELGQAINDLVSACASTRPANALPPMIRAQSSAASLSAALEVLSRLVTTALQSPSRSPFDQEIARAASMVAAEFATSGVQARPAVAHLTEDRAHAAPEVDSIPMDLPMSPDVSQFEAPPFEQELPVEPLPSDRVMQPGGEMLPVVGMPPAVEPVFLNEANAVVAQELPVMEFVPAPVRVQVPEPQLPMESVIAPETDPEIAPQEGQPVFDVAMLPPEERELHRRAYRVAKVSMQDIKMLHPEDIRLGRENKDLCFRLREDIEKAHKEYGRRFQSIYTHPVDYFYDWMVEILAGGNPEALGEYPYPSPVLRR